MYYQDGLHEMSFSYFSYAEKTVNFFSLRQSVFF